MSITDRLAAVQRRIDAACERAGRPLGSVRLLPTTKTHTLQDIMETSDAGYSTVAESRPQELAEKAIALADTDIRFVAIGRLQTNKAGLIAAHASEFQALDSVKLAHALQRRLDALDATLDVLIQVNTSNEPQKAGIAPSDALSFAQAVAECDRLRVRGLMTLAVHSTDESLVASCFARLTRLREELQTAGAPGNFTQLSMGMSGDFELAIAHGSTCVRVGSAIYGKR